MKKTLCLASLLSFTALACPANPARLFNGQAPAHPALQPVCDATARAAMKSLQTVQKATWAEVYRFVPELGGPAALNQALAAAKYTLTGTYPKGPGAEIRTFVSTGVLRPMNVFLKRTGATTFLYVYQ